MTLDLYFREDLRNILAGLAVSDAAHMVVDTSAEATAFRAGYRAALTAVATSLGITMPLQCEAWSADDSVRTLEV